MTISLIVTFLVLGIIGSIAYLISRRVYRNLVIRGFKSPKAISAVTFVVSFIGLIAILCTVFILNFRFER